MGNGKWDPVLGISQVAPAIGRIEPYQTWPRNLLELFERSVNKFSNKEAVVEETRELSYKKIHQKSRSLAGYLQKEFNLRKGERVGLLMDHSLEFCTSVIGILYCGGIVYPLDTRIDEIELNTIIQHSKLRVIVVKDELGPRFDYLLKEMQVIKESEVLSIRQKYMNELRIPVAIQKEDPAFILQSSGEYSRPKEEFFTHGNGVHTCLRYERAPISTGPDSVIGIPVDDEVNLLSQLMAFLNLGFTICLKNVEYKKY